MEKHESCPAEMIETRFELALNKATKEIIKTMSEVVQKEMCDVRNMIDQQESMAAWMGEFSVNKKRYYIWPMVTVLNTVLIIVLYFTR